MTRMLIPIKVIKMDWFETGISTLDDHISGFPKGRTTLVLGTPGAGKTILALQFADRCLESGLSVLYIATEERPEDLIQQAASIGLEKVKDCCEKEDLIIRPLFRERAEDIKALYLMDYQRISKDFLLLTTDIPDNIDVVIIDNIGVFSVGLSPQEFRDQYDMLVYLLSKKGYTSLVISDESVDERLAKIAMYSSYAVFRMYKSMNTYTSKMERIMDVVKIRNSPTPAEYLLYDITEEGISISGTVRT